MRSLLQKSFSKKAAGLMLGALCLFGSDAFAATFTANNNSNNKNWDDKQAWLVNGAMPNSGPSASDDVVIPAGQTIPIQSGLNAACTSLIVQGTLNNAGSLTIGGGTLVEGNLNNTGTFSTTNNVSVTTGILTLGGTAINSFTYAGWLNFGSNGTLVLNNTNITTIPEALSLGNVSIQNAPASGLTILENYYLTGTLTIFNGKKLSIINNSVLTATTISMQPSSEIEIVNAANVEFTSYIVDATSTINYSGTGGTVKGGNYGILKVAGITTLAADATVTGSLNLTNGSIYLGSNNLTIQSVGSITGATSTNYVKLGTGKLTIQNVGPTGKTGAILFPIGSTTSYTPATIQNTGMTQNFSVGLTNSVSNMGSIVTNNVVNKTWDITPSGSGANVNLILQWNHTDEVFGFTGVDASKNFNRMSCKIMHFDNATNKWDNKSVGSAFAAAKIAGTNTDATPSSTGAFTITRNNITTFSPFAVSDGLSPLPVELVNFTAAKKAGEVALSWETASEKNNSGFEVQASVDGKNYEAVAFVASRNSNSSSAQRYAYSHKTANQEGLMYFRLKQVDLNGTFEYYTAKTVDLGRINATANTFPNPFQNRFELNLTATVTETADILVMDMTGKTVYAAKQNLSKGVNTISVELNNQPAGLYLLKATAGNQTYTNRLVKQ